MAKQPQHLEALDLANKVRLARAEVKREVLAGTKQVVDMLLDVPECLETCRVIELLMAQRRWGRRRSLKLLNTHHIQENRHVGALTLRQRGLLIHDLKARPNGN
jgi:hypothetical protein